MPNPDPELGLTVTRRFPDQGEINSSLVDRDGNCVYACELSWPSAATDGCIWEIGGSGQGSWIGLHSTQGFVFTAGGGGIDGWLSGNGKATFSINNAAFFSLYGGQSGTLCWEIQYTPPRIRAWWNNDLIGEAASPSGAWENNRFSGGNTGGFGRGVSSLVRSMPGTSFATIDSVLRYYDGQLTSWVEAAGGPGIYVGASGFDTVYVGARPLNELLIGPS